jgi:predicted LPLAT superfamily acyltransferase
MVPLVKVVKLVTMSQVSPLVAMVAVVEPKLDTQAVVVTRESPMVTLRVQEALEELHP